MIGVFLQGEVERATFRTASLVFETRPTTSVSRLTGATTAHQGGRILREWFPNWPTLASHVEHTTLIVKVDAVR